MLPSKIVKMSNAPQGFGQTPDDLEPLAFASALPVQHSHSEYENDDLGLYVGLWDTTAMSERPGPYSMDEFMWLLEGEANIKNCQSGEVQNVKAGEAFVIPQGYHCQWLQPGYLRKFYFIAEHPNEAMPGSPTVNGIIKPHQQAPQTAFEPNQFFNIEGDAPIQKNDVAYKNNRGSFYAGTFDSQAFNSHPQAFPVNLFGYLLEGTIILNEENGSEQTFGPGDAFFIPQGTDCSWIITEYARLNYAVLAA